MSDDLKVGPLDVFLGTLMAKAVAEQMEERKKYEEYLKRLEEGGYEPLPVA